MPELTVPTSTNGQPKVNIGVREENKIGLANYSNVTIAASIYRYVDDSDDLSDELKKAHKEIVDFLDNTYIEERRSVLAEEASSK